MVCDRFYFCFNVCNSAIIYFWKILECVIPCGSKLSQDRNRFTVLVSVTLFTWGHCFSFLGPSEHSGSCGFLLSAWKCQVPLSLLFPTLSMDVTGNLTFFPVTILPVFSLHGLCHPPPPEAAIVTAQASRCPKSQGGSYRGNSFTLGWAVQRFFHCHKVKELIWSHFQTSWERTFTSSMKRSGRMSLSTALLRV
jgi:hypothetical protein